MCVAVPGQITRIGEASGLSIPATILIGGSSREVDLIMVPEAVVGDYVMFHSGYAVGILPRDSAEQTLELLGEGPHSPRT